MKERLRESEGDRMNAEDAEEEEGKGTEMEW